jgi:hypothetical protein
MNVDNFEGRAMKDTDRDSDKDSEKNSEKDSDIELLWKTYDLVKYWLEYGEKKNLALLTIVGFEMTILNFFEKQVRYEYLKISLTPLILAFIMALISFYPKTDYLEFLKRTKLPEDIGMMNLIFYGDIQKLSIGSYIDAMERHNDIRIRGNKSAEDLCSQIVILSKIATNKFTLFKTALFMAMLGQITLFFFIVL